MKWKNCTLNDICDKANGHIQTGPFGSQLHQSDYSDTGTPVVMPKDIINGKISEDEIARVEDQHVLRLSRHKVGTGDILFSRRGDVGRCAYISEKEAGWLCGTGCLRVTVDAEIVDSRFVFYCLQQPSSVEWIEKHAIGATMLNLNTGILASVPLLLPDLPTQHRIASILSAYDDLIENNRRQIKLLEEAAQRLYREWFVVLRFPGHENVKIVDGVPEEWSVIKIQDILTVCYGKDHKKVADGDIPVYGSGGYMRACERPLYTGQSVLIPRKGSLNNIMYVDEGFWTVDTMFYTVMKLPHIAHYVFQFMKTLDFYNMNTGAAVPSTTSETLNNLMIMVPKESILKQFDGIVQGLVSMKTCLEKQIRTLTDTRDLLLPKLMSGEIEV